MTLFRLDGGGEIETAWERSGERMPEALTRAALMTGVGSAHAEFDRTAG